MPRTVKRDGDDKGCSFEWTLKKPVLSNDKLMQIFTRHLGSESER